MHTPLSYLFHSSNLGSMQSAAQWHANMWKLCCTLHGTNASCCRCYMLHATHPNIFLMGLTKCILA